MSDLAPTDPGDYRQAITIQQASASPDSFGEETLTWSTFALAWAKVNQLAGREQYYARQVVSLATHQVRMRYLNGITEQMQIVWNGRTLRIEYIDNLDNRNIELVLTCVEVK